MIERLLAGLLGVPFLLGAAAAPAQHAQVVFTFQDPAIIEASALVVLDGLVVTSNDSGDTGRVFAVDPKTGRTVGVTQWEDHPTDVESLAPGSDPHSVWVGDIGDNDASRSSIQVAEVPVGRGDRTVHPTVYDLTYPNGPQDAETLVRDPATGRLYIASKFLFGGTLYAVPKHLSADHANRLTRVGSVLPIATDGAFFPDGKHVIIRNYEVATVYSFPSLEKVTSVRLPSEPQGEGIGLEPDGQLLVDSEGLHSQVLRLTLPAALRDLVLPPEATASASAAASQTASPQPTRPPAASPIESTPVDHTAWWLLAGVVGLVGVAVAGGTWRRRR